MLPPAVTRQATIGSRASRQAIGSDELAATAPRSAVTAPTDLPPPTGAPPVEVRSTERQRFRWSVEILTRRRLQILSIVGVLLVAFANVVVRAGGWLRIGLRSALVLTILVAAASLATVIVTWARERIRRRRNRFVRRAEGDHRPGRSGGSIGTGSGSDVIGSSGWANPPPPAPLVNAAEQRVFATAIAGRRSAGPIDVGGVVDRVARRQSVTPVPRLVRWTVARGVVVHAQQGAAMEPFAADVSGLIAELRAAIADDAVELVGIDRDPTVISGPPRLLRRLRHEGAEQGDGGFRLGGHLPARGATVLAITDLGIGTTRSAPASVPPTAWWRHHDLVRAAGCRICYLVPYPPERWPAELRDLPIVEWRDGVSPSEVQRVVFAQESTS